MAHVLHYNKKKFPEDFLPYCSVHQHGCCDVRWIPTIRGEPARLGGLGSVSQKSRKLFGPEKPFVKLSTACSDLVAQSVERRRSYPKVVGSISTQVRVFLCPCVGPFPSVGLTLTWFIWDRILALHITLYSVSLFWKADLLTWFQRNCEVCRLKSSPFLRYKGNCDTRKRPVKFRDFRETGPCPGKRAEVFIWTFPACFTRMNYVPCNRQSHARDNWWIFLFWFEMRFILALASMEWHFKTKDAKRKNPVNMQIWPRFQGNPRVVTILHPGKPGWTVYMRILQPSLPRSRQTGISASGPARLSR